MRRALTAMLVLAMILQVTLGCVFAAAATQAESVVCCATHCPQHAPTNHRQCCKVSPHHETEVSSATSTSPRLFEIAAPLPRQHAAMTLAELGRSIALCSALAPPIPVVDRLCSRQL